MKRILKITVTLMIICLILACRKEPEVPEPATPKGLSYQVQEESIFFSWFEAKNALSYDVEIAADAELTDLVYSKEGIADTFRLVSCDSFVADSTYYWRVRAEGEAGVSDWSNIVNFTYTADTGKGTLDLDTTYFPFGLGYEWCFERHNYGFDSWEEWDYYDTTIVKVTDSFWKEDTLFFKIDGSGLYDINYYVAGFLAKINNAKIRVFTYPYPWDTIALVPKEQEGGENTCEVSYNDDTLELYSGYDWGDIGISESGFISTSRIRGIGILHQIKHWDDYGAAEDNKSGRLLYFYNGEDTVYMAQDSGESVEIDLDTTYFPLGEDYQWTYQRHFVGSESSGDSTIITEEYDTFTVTVSDSFWVCDVIQFNFADYTKPFFDLGNPASVFLGKVLLVMWSDNVKNHWIDPYSPEEYGSAIRISYLDDTLKISYGSFYPPMNYRKEWIKRVRKIGDVMQYCCDYDDDTGKDTEITDSLISFTTPQGQVYP